MTTVRQTIAPVTLPDVPAPPSADLDTASSGLPRPSPDVGMATVRQTVTLPDLPTQLPGQPYEDSARPAVGVSAASIVSTAPSDPAQAVARPPMMQVAPGDVPARPRNEVGAVQSGTTTAAQKHQISTAGPAGVTQDAPSAAGVSIPAAPDVPTPRGLYPDAGVRPKPGIADRTPGDGKQSFVAAGLSASGGSPVAIARDTASPAPPRPAPGGAQGEVAVARPPAAGTPTINPDAAATLPVTVTIMPPADTTAPPAAVEPARDQQPGWQPWTPGRVWSDGATAGASRATVLLEGEGPANPASASRQIPAPVIIAAEPAAPDRHNPVLYRPIPQGPVLREPEPPLAPLAIAVAAGAPAVGGPGSTIALPVVPQPPEAGESAAMPAAATPSTTTTSAPHHGAGRESTPANHRRTTDLTGLQPGQQPALDAGGRGLGTDPAGAVDILPGAGGVIHSGPPASQGALAAATPGGPTPSLPATPAQQIAQSAIISGDRIEIRLDPEELGSVRVTMVADGDRMRVVIMTERPETLELLRRNVGDLAQEFRNLGYEGSSFSFGHSGRQGTHRGMHGETGLAAPDPVAATPVPAPARTAAGAVDLRL